uniref:serine/threonine-protein kinase Chk2-like n=1 Tax=Myxine glutinosa TaxID=7769 RepID=UPI00358FD5B2
MASGPSSGAGTSSSAGTGSSADTVSTQRTEPECESQEPRGDTESRVAPWGIILPILEGFPSMELVNTEYSFGRDFNCDYTFPKNNSEPQRYKTYSSRHFHIFLNGDPFLQDDSMNGTYMNGKLLSRDDKVVLPNYATIALGEPEHHVLTFCNLMRQDGIKLPEGLRDRYMITKELGTGVFGRVLLAFCVGSLERVAIKMIPKHDLALQEAPTTNVQAEAAILQRLAHPGIIRFLEACDSEEAFFIVLEYAEGGELSQWVKRRKELCEKRSKFVFYQIVLAVHYLNEQGIIHRDLKLQNVLLASMAEEPLVKVTDFGVARIAGDQSVARTLCGTLHYLAPEVLDVGKSKTGYGKAVDCWALGVILFWCLSGCSPFVECPVGTSMAEQIRSRHVAFDAQVWKTISQSARDLVTHLLTVDPSQRCTTQQALEHPWLQDPEMKMKVQQLWED